MTDKELKTLKENLWHAADMLRAGAHLAANKYGQPILGLIFLRYADILYKQHKDEIEAEYNKYKGGRREKTKKEISIEKCGFYLPECAYYDEINDAPDDANKATLVKKAMEAIETENAKMEGVLPKEVYGQLVPEEEPELLSKIVRIFKDIPENCTVDIFGEIYEYFLGKFALAEGKDGGTFYTPATVVRYMVEVLNPQPGDKKFLDPACGSGGMFVQAARYMHKHNASEDDQMKFRCYGVEKEPDTVKLAKMNLLLNNVRGDITEANSFYSDPYNAVGQFDYVMANPPFNVDEVVVDKVSEDERFNTYGVPRNSSKSAKKASDKKETVPNANYLWIGYFATAMNERGKAALVMANSASDAGKSEYEIRKKLIEEGVISQMVTLPSNMFNSVTLPATLWFFDKAKANSDKKDEILFIDARNVFTQVDRAHRKFSDEQIKNLGIITHLYNGDTEAYTALLEEYREKANQLTSELRKMLSKLSEYSFYFDGDGTGEYETPQLRSCAPKTIVNKDACLAAADSKNVVEYRGIIEKQDYEIEGAYIGLHFEQYYSKKQDKKIKEYDQLVEDARGCIGEIKYYLDNITWLLERFPEGKYRDVIGLCKAAKLDGEDGIIDQDYSLNAGRYVGVVIEDDGMTEAEFKETMLGLNAELTALNAEAKKLEEQIAENMKGLFGV
ncbi:MAG: class I SAM-dependent DNA methyltransferase [Bacillota bacterium]|nr:class I SAM-dependent DNA methyltransferase [Bacillota bacterium]